LEFGRSWDRGLLECGSSWDSGLLECGSSWDRGLLECGGSWNRGLLECGIEAGIHLLFWYDLFTIAMKPSRVFISSGSTPAPLYGEMGFWRYDGCEELILTWWVCHDSLRIQVLMMRVKSSNTAIPLAYSRPPNYAP